MAEFDPSKRLSLMTIIHIENRLSDMLGTKVDLSPAHAMHATVRTRALREAVHAF